MQADNQLGTVDTLTQMVGVLGFHDLGSFFIASAFVIVLLAFLIGGIVVIIKKRRERLALMEKIIAKIPQVKPQAVEETKPIVVDKPESITPQPVVVVKHAVPEPAPKPVSKPVQVSPPVITPAIAPSPSPVITTPAVAPVPTPVIVPPPVVVEKPASLGSALKNTRNGFIAKLSRLFGADTDVNDADFEELEAILFTADIGAKTAQKLLDVMRERARIEKNINKTFLLSVLKQEMIAILEGVSMKPVDAVAPQVIMFVGVNGAGKTTSIGKLGARFIAEGRKVIFGAGDTFRAAAVEQLSIWGKRIGAEVVRGAENADSASVLFSAIEAAQAHHADVVLCDTAGRLHTKTSLMDELSKVHRVVGKAQAGAPHQVLLVIDATMGQNAINQAREFALATPLTGIILSKLDGTAKGGVALGIVDELKLPICYIGIGEKDSDLRDFNAKQFVDALFNENA